MSSRSSALTPSRTPALDAGDIDMNRFQHIAYLSNYNVSAKKDLQIVGPTVIYPDGSVLQEALQVG